MAEKSKVIFMFGAGAESGYDIGVGESFIKPLLENRYKDDIKRLLGDACNNYPLIHKNSKKVFVQTICSHPKEFPNERMVEICEKYRDGNLELQEEKDELTENCRKWCEGLRDSSCIENKDEIDFFYKHTVFFDSLDSKFNDLRNDPINGPGKRVINAYYTVFYHLISELYDKHNISTFQELYKLLRRDYDINKLKKTYYDVLKEKGLNSIPIVTTNYTKLAQSETGCGEVIYLHGKLTWFEDYRDLRIYDIERNEIPEEDKEDFLIPFILIPSGIKPLICSKQIEEFAKFIEALKVCNYLCVVGYRFNSEDNHINAIIADWLRNSERNKLIIFRYSESDNFDEFSKERWMDDLSVCTYIPESNPDLFRIPSRIINIPINKDNAITRYETLIDNMKKEKIIV